MTSIFSEHNELLKELWQQFNPEGEQYLEKDKLKEWIKAAYERNNLVANYEETLSDTEALIKQYLIEVHQANTEQMDHLALNYQEATGFLRWAQMETEHHNAEEEEVKGENKEEKQEKQQISEGQHIEPQEKEQQEVVAGEEMQRSHNVSQLQRSNSSPKIDNKSRAISNNEFEGMRGSRGIEEPNNERSPKKIKTQISNQQQQNATTGPNEFSLESLSKKYKDYLRIIFQHYCKISYATGNDPTFEQIKHKTTIMTINKFMMFCKDFQIGSIKKEFNRNFLVEIFKKNSECYKEMNLQQFGEVIRKIAGFGFADEKDETENRERAQSGLLPVEMVKMMEHCQLSTSKYFREKMKRLNIQYRSGPKTTAEMKVVPEGYRFKFSSNNGKSQEQVKQELQERKQHRSQRKILLQQKVNNQQVEPNQFRKRVLSKKTNRIVSREKQLAPIREINVQSTGVLNKVLSPPIVPARKISNLPPSLPPKASSTPYSQQSNQSQSNNTAANIFKKQYGYADLHKIKQSEGYGKKKSGINKGSSRQDKSSFRLNSIVEQARHEVKQMPHEPSSDNLTDSIATYSREEANRSKNYDMSKINMKMQIINQKLQRDREIQQDLTNLIDLSHDEDEFLMQHLEREKKNQLVSKRVSQRINELDRY